MKKRYNNLLKHEYVATFLALTLTATLSHATDSEEANWKRQWESETKFAIETDKGSFYVDKVKNKAWASAVLSLMGYAVTSGETKIIIYHYDKNILGIKTEKGSIHK